MARRWLLAIAPAALVVGACATGSGIVRERAANEFSCDESEVEVEAIGGNSYRATGCGQEATYTCRSRYEYTGLSGQSMPCVHDEDVATAVKESGRAAASAAAKPALPKAKEPHGAAGFAFGDGADAVQAACESSGHKYESTSADHATCDGMPQDIGVSGHALFRYCAGHLCLVTLVLEPGAKQLEKSVVSLKTALAAKYGTPGASLSVVPPSCLSDLAACIKSDDAKVRLEWTWPSRSGIVLAVVKPPKADDDPLIHVSYSSPDVYGVHLQSTGL